VMIPVLGIAAGQVFGEDDAAQPVSPAPTSPNPDDGFLTGEPPTPETVQGFWRVDNNPIMVRLTADGRVSFADNGQLLHEPGLRGSYDLNGDRIDVTVRGGPDECVGQEFALRVSLPEPRLMRFVLVQQGELSCWPVPIRGALEQVLPTSPRLEDPLSDSEGWQFAVDKEALFGHWLAHGGGGHVLELTPDGTYYVADNSLEVVDTGTWSFRGQRLALTSSVGSLVCSSGDQLVLGAVELVFSGDWAGAMRSDVELNDCGAAWAEHEWILIPYVRS
jgi:hypothetical protein